MCVTFTYISVMCVTFTYISVMCVTFTYISVMCVTFTYISMMCGTFTYNIVIGRFHISGSSESYESIFEHKYSQWITWRHDCVYSEIELKSVNKKWLQNETQNIRKTCAMKNIETTSFNLCLWFCTGNLTQHSVRASSPKRANARVEGSSPGWAYCLGARLKVWVPCRKLACKRSHNR